MKRTNRRIQVLASMYSCSDKERMFMENVGGDEVERFITTTTFRDGFVCCRFPQRIGNKNEWLSKNERGVRME